MRPLEVRHLGVISYADGLALQAELVQARRAGTIPDTLLLLQHPHVLTVGVKKDGRRNILATPEQLASLGVEVFDTGRGGDVTYHGPGQIVGYPIIDLNPDRRNVHRYVRDLEEVMIRVCTAYGVEAGRLAGLTGTWVTHPTRGPEKIGAIGVRISRWVTSHGLALNVATDLAFFDLIVPCGIADRGVTSLERVTRRPLDLAEVAVALSTEMAAVFERDVTHTIAAA
ncbi:MAG TPA: lipoyl(octanoyl) transferase LipB [Vicinamibacterales bacterium]|nr:lipoyl(octanoyl) transferase LipB [Vicinamibacterales bacterium]